MALRGRDGTWPSRLTCAAVLLASLMNLSLVSSVAFIQPPPPATSCPRRALRTCSSVPTMQVDASDCMPCLTIAAITE